MLPSAIRNEYHSGMRRWSVKALAVLVVLAAVAAAAVYALGRRSLPAVDGAITVNGISAPVEIIRDADAIPHIFASTKLDALYGLGYAHAQDRLWQMEFQRRIGHGRLSEIFGSATLPQDRFLRTVGFGRAARAAWAGTPDWARRQVDAYVAGINAFLAGHHGSALPPEFSILRIDPEPWSGVDVLVWVKMMAWDLSANYTFELLRSDLAGTVGAERAAALMPPYARDGLSILGGSRGDSGSAGPGRSAGSDGSGNSGGGGGPGRAEHNTLQAFVLGLSRGEPAVRDLLLGGGTTEALGSNNWVADGTLTVSGKPLLANDPHLGTHVPSTWYLAHMSAGDFDVIGATLPGAPAVALGRNRFIGWGATNVAADVEDLYREHIDATGRFAEFRGAQEPLQIIAETIQVKGAAPVRVDVRLTRHGPLVSDAINASSAEQPSSHRPPPVEPLAFRWTALDPDDTTLGSFLLINEATNWDDFTAALREFVVPSQNFVYADVAGHIGYYAPGRIPIRAHGDGALPADGWTGDAEWIGWIPFGALPHLFDPPTHFIVTANHRPAPPEYPYFLGLEWPEPYRAQRITDLLRQGIDEGRRLGPDEFATIQRDTLSLHARSLLPLLLPRAHPQEARDRQAVEILRSWNLDARGDSSAAAIFETWFLRLAPTLAGDKLGPAATENYQKRFSFVTRFVVSTLAAGDSPWCDDTRTAKRETCDDAVTAALHDAVGELTRRLGTDPVRWRWDGVHRAVFPHQGLDAVAALRPLLSRSVPAGGDWSTVDVGPVDTDHGFEQRSVPGYREILDLSPANDSRFLGDVGESGHPLSPHYDDFLSDWRAVRHRRMRMRRADVEAGAIGRLRLAP
jgi:penicillin amidase